MSIPLQKNPKNTKTLRQELRASATPAEKLLWQYIKEKQIDNYRFRRQHGVGPYILDFYCPSLRLGVRGGSRDPKLARRVVFRYPATNHLYNRLRVTRYFLVFKT